MERWSPQVGLTEQEKMLIKRLTRVRPLFGFPRFHRQEIFDGEFQEALDSAYRVTGAGAPPHPPEMLRMVLLL